MKRSKPVLALAASLLALSLTACASGGYGARDGGADVSQSSGQFLSEESAASDSAGVSTERSIIHTGSLAIEVESPTESAERVSTIVSELGGSVASKSVSNSGSSAESASLQVRVPADKLDEAFNRLGEVGKVLNEERSADDVTEMHVDLQARVEALQTSVDRLTELMEGAATTSELLEAESALSERQQELDGLQAQLTSLEGQVAEANIWISLNTPRVLPGGGPTNFWEALVAGFSSIGDFGKFAMIALGLSLPWLVIAAVVTLAIVIPIRRRRARRRQGVPVAAGYSGVPAATAEPGVPAGADPHTSPQPGQATEDDSAKSVANDQNS